MKAARTQVRPGLLFAEWDDEVELPDVRGRLGKGARLLTAGRVYSSQPLSRK